MRIAFPVRIPLSGALIYAALLMVIQVAEHTDPTFAGICFAFTMTVVLAFNVTGGLTRPSGGYIFSYGLLTVELGLIWKALLGEPANSNLLSPVTTMLAYWAGAVALLIAAFLKRFFVKRPEGFADWIGVADVDLGHSSLGCFLIFFGLSVLNGVLPAGSGSLLAILNQLNSFWPLGVILGTIAAIKQSNGQRSLAPLTVIAMIYFTIMGMLYFSKQGMLTGMVCWVIGASYMRYRLRVYQIFVLIFLMAFSSYVFSPISQLGRAKFIGGDLSDRAALVMEMVTNLQATRAEYQETAEFYNSQEGAIHYFNEPEGLMDRLTMMAADDSLINFSEHTGRYIGYAPIAVYFANWVPHFIWKDKPVGLYGGNSYAHEMGHLSDDDLTTGISFSPAAEGYHMDGFRGILVCGVFVWTLLFLSTDLLCGDVRRQPWGLLAILAFAHYAPEFFFGGPILFMWTGNIGLMFAIVFCGYVAPVLGVLIGGSRERQQLRAASLIGSARGRPATGPGAALSPDAA